MMVAAGGAIGATGRFLVQQCALTPSEKYVQTLGVNLTGCMLIGVVWALLIHLNAPQWLHRLLVAGILGGYTTFSAFSLDCMQLIQSGRFLTAAVYLLISVAGGILLCAAAYTAISHIL